MENITVVEMLDYVEAIDMAGITLTENGRNAARIIMEKRAFDASHKLMLARIDEGQKVLPHKLRKLVWGTRLGDALELARKLARPHIRNQKARARRKAARARAAA